MAVLFDDASTEYLVYSYAPVSALGVTIACWAYDDSTVLNDRCLVQIQAPDVDNRYIRLGIGDDMNNAATALPAAASMSASGLSAQASLANSSSNRTLNQWHHFLGTYASGSRFAYLDGSGGSENTAAGDPFADDTLDTIAIASEQDSTPGDEWSGGILWPAVWDKILDADEIAMAAAGVHPTKIAPESLVFFAPLDNAQGYRDWISGVAPTVNGTPVYTDGPHVMSDGGIIVPYNTANPPTVTDVNGDETFDAPSTGNTITGTNFL